MAGFRVPGPQCVTRSGPMDRGTSALTHMPTPGPLGGIESEVGAMGPTQRIAEVIRRAARLLPGDAGKQLSELLTPGTLAIVAGVLVLWAGSHAFGIGEAIDILLLATGAIFIGREAIDAVDHLVKFARLAVQGSSVHDLDEAAKHLSAAVTIIGVNVVLVLLTRGGVKAYQGRYRPTIKGTRTMEAGAGGTDKYGNITYSTLGSDTDRALVLFHEKVHSALSPKLMPLRELRADLRMTGYQKSSFLRYLEEALAEGYAQLRVNGIKGLPEAIRFPVANGYVTVRAVVKEAAIGAGVVTVTIGGIVYVVDAVLDGD